jgi:hypothetical protein
MPPTLDDYIEKSEKYDADDTEHIPADIESEVNTRLETATSETDTVDSQ